VLGRHAFISFAGAVLVATGPLAAPASRADVEDCSAFLSGHWRDEIAAHPINPAKHVLIIGIDTPLHDPRDRTRRQATTALKQAFPSFQESPDSGILLGCCALPLFGSISFGEMATLSNQRFAPLCVIGRRARSTAVGLRAEYRAPYERGEAVEAYFFSYWRRKPVS
jgi:hypothetical protein